MKKIITIILIIISTSTFSQNCNIGNEDSTGFDNISEIFYENFLVGIKLNLSTSGVLTSLNLLGNNSGAQVQMAVYEDIAGVPGDLIVASTAATIGTGIISLPVIPTDLIPGNYWIMAIYDTDGIHSFSNTSPDNVLYYQELTFGTTIPPNASSFLSYTGQDFTYFMEITCNQVGVSDINDLSRMSFYPNPAIDLVTINVDENLIGSTYIISDLLGKQMLTGKLNNETCSIDISQLNTGVYILQAGHQRKQTLKFIKE